MLVRNIPKNIVVPRGAISKTDIGNAYAEYYKHRDSAIRELFLLENKDKDIFEIKEFETFKF